MCSTAQLRIPRLPEIYQKPLRSGHLIIMDKILGPKGVRYRGVPLYTRSNSEWPLTDVTLYEMILLVQKVALK